VGKPKLTFRLRLQAEVLGLKYIIEVSEGTRGGYMEQNVGRRNIVRGLLVSLSSLNLWLVASALSRASVDLPVDF